MDVRVALPEMGITDASKAKVADPALSTAVGILLHGAELGGCTVIERPAAPQPAAAPTASTGTSGNSAAAPTPAPGLRRPYTPTPPAPESFRHVPPRQQPQPTPSTATPLQPQPESELENDAPEHDEQPVQQPAEPRRRRDLSSFLHKTLETINKKFSAAEDEEI